MTMLTHTYNPTFFASIAGGSTRSAERIVPMVLSWLPSRSVIDVGCGDGSWLAEFRRCGVKTIFGVDGGDIPRSQLKIPDACFERHDLTLGLRTGRSFDLAVSLEVAEHLPPSRAAAFVADLTSLAPRVLFSAAIPFQRGTHHVNCRWPDYWQSLFAAQGYVALDILRPALWDDDEVEFWYRQNAVLYVQRDLVARDERLAALAAQAKPRLPRLVHPKLCEQWDQLSVREVVGLLPGAVKGALSRRMRRLSRAVAPPATADPSANISHG